MTGEVSSKKRAAEWDSNGNAAKKQRSESECNHCKLFKHYHGSNPLPPELALHKMILNHRKAMDEHESSDPSGAFWSSKRLVSRIETEKKRLTPLDLSFASDATQGMRKVMEDYHFIKKIPQKGLLAGVFDGHGGAEVSKLANELFQTGFEVILEKCEGNVHKTFETLAHEVHYDAVSQKMAGGSCGAVSFIEIATGLMYVFTLGDCEVNIYREDACELKSISLSPLRHWAYRTECKRAAIYMGDPRIAYEWRTKNPASLRLANGLNISRAFGDALFEGTDEKPGVIHKGKISVCRLEEDDTIVIACDGLRVRTKEEEIVKAVKEHSSSPDLLSKRLVEMSKYKGDNVSVIVIKVPPLADTSSNE